MQPRHEINIDTAPPQMTVGDAVAVSHAVRFGAPGKCPQCGKPGFLDYVDIKRGVSDSSCKSCRVTWNFSRNADGTAALVEV